MNAIFVQKRAGEENTYEFSKEITDEKAVGKIDNILKGIARENAKVKMASPPHYKFLFKKGNEQSETDKLMFDFWISLQKDKVELLIVGESKYTQLNKSKSAELFEIITDEKLNDVK